MKLFILLLPLLAYGGFAPKSSVETCILLSTGKLTPPPEAEMVVSASCAVEPCFAITPEFNCIYYKISGDILELDTAKKATYDAQKAAADVLATKYDISQIWGNVNTFCLYETYNPCKGIPASNQESLARDLSGILNKTEAEILKLMRH